MKVIFSVESIYTLVLNLILKEDQMLDKYFDYRKHKTDFNTEVRAGVYDVFNDGLYLGFAASDTCRQVVLILVVQCLLLLLLLLQLACFIMRPSTLRLGPLALVAWDGVKRIHVAYWCLFGALGYTPRRGTWCCFGCRNSGVLANFS